ncbi:hypothetical protein GpartN1_g7692.t1 [Galdieria partita]|uniref:Golgin-84 n=1 Tax=Galdieria partita TaxID=83374 RepID=A0A9C7Q6Z3_9RHOD|nr:hypothetical protein GpartN1_g7692.t1 [Galdieria partita]
MSFIQRTLKKAEDFLESFDENVANYSRKVALESSEWEDDENDSTPSLPPSSLHQHSEKYGATLQNNNSLENNTSSKYTETDNNTQTSVYRTQPPSKETDDEFTDIAFVTDDAKVVSSFRREGRQSDSFRYNELKNQLAQVTKERNGYARQLQKAKELLEELQFELGEERKRYRQLEEEKNEQIWKLERKVEQFDWQLQQLGREKEDAIEAYKVALAELEERMKQLTEECTSWQQKANQLQEELERKTQEQQDLNFSVHEEIRRLSEELEKEKTSHQATTSAYQEKAHEWEAQFFAFQEREAELEKNLFMEQQENKNLASRIQELEYHLEMETSRSTQVQQKLENIQNYSTWDAEKQAWMERVDWLSQQLEERDEKINRLERQWTTFQEQAEAHLHAVPSDTVTSKETRPFVPMVEENIQVLEDKLKQMTDSLLEKQNQIESLRSTARVLSSQLDTERRRASQLEAMTVDSMQRNNTSGYSTGDWNLSESSNYRPLRIRRAPRIVQKLLKVLDRFLALCLLILRREPLIRFSLFVYIFLMNIFFILSLSSSNSYSVRFS